MKMTGHKTESVYRRYAIVDSTMLKEAAVKLAVLHAGENRTYGLTPGQIERLVIDRYKREHPQEQQATPVAHEPRWQPVVVQGSAMAFDTGRDPPPDNVTEFNSVRALLADIKKSQPLVPAGPSQNGVHTEPNPAS